MIAQQQLGQVPGSGMTFQYDQPQVQVFDMKRHKSDNSTITSDGTFRQNSGTDKDTFRADNNSGSIRDRMKSSNSNHLTAKSDDLKTEDALESEQRLKNTIRTSDSIKEVSDPNSSNQVFVTGKSYAGLLSGCIAVDRQ